MSIPADVLNALLSFAVGGFSLKALWREQKTTGSYGRQRLGYAAPEAEVDAPISRILVPVEISAQACGAADVAMSLARSLRAQITLLRIERPEGDPIWLSEQVRRKERDLAGLLPDETGAVKVQRSVLVDHDVPGAILRFATDSRTDLIVMPTHGHGRMRRWLLGSLTDSVLNRAPCAVWTSAHMNPAPGDEWITPECILCVVDTALRGSRVLNWSSCLASALNLRLAVVWDRKMLLESPEEMDWLQRRHAMESEIIVRSVNSVEALKNTAIRLRAGLLVTARESWGAPEEAGSNTYRLVRQMPCAVVSL